MTSAFAEQSSSSIDKSKLALFVQALKNQNTGITLKSFLINQVSKEVESIQQALEQQNYKDLKFLFHHLLSTSSALGFIKLANLCRSAEDACLEQDIHQVRHYNAEINQELQKILTLPYEEEGFFSTP